MCACIPIAATIFLRSALSSTLGNSRSCGRRTAGAPRRVNFPNGAPGEDACDSVVPYRAQNQADQAGRVPRKARAARGFRCLQIDQDAKGTRDIEQNEAAQDTPSAQTPIAIR